MENRQNYLSKMELKKEKFAISPTCRSSKQEIDDIDNAVLYRNFLYHRAFCPQLTEDNSRTRLTVNSIVKVKMNNREYEFENMSEAYNRILKNIQLKLSEMPQDERDYYIEGLEQFDFIGNHDKVDNYISLQGITTIKTKELRIDNQQGESIVIDISGGRGEMIKNIKSIASLFRFMSDFDIE